MPLHKVGEDTDEATDRDNIETGRLTHQIVIMYRIHCIN